MQILIEAITSSKQPVLQCENYISLCSVVDIVVSRRSKTCTKRNPRIRYSVDPDEMLYLVIVANLPCENLTTTIARFIDVALLVRTERSVVSGERVIVDAVVKIMRTLLLVSDWSVLVGRCDSNHRIHE